MSRYLDTSALAKIIVDEDHSAALRAWLGDSPAVPLVTCSIGVVELHRLAARVSAEASAAAVLLTARVDVLELTPSMLTLAGRLPPPTVRTLDALHIAAAAFLPDLEVLVTYDHRMAEAARGYGLPTSAPR